MVGDAVNKLKVEDKALPHFRVITSDDLGLLRGESVTSTSDGFITEC
jgi:hypothetical protein